MKTKIKRTSIRFKPDDNALALIDLKPSNKGFNPSIPALILNESFTGCSVLFACDEDLKKGKKIRIKIGNLHPMKASLIWIKEFEESIFKVGIKLLE